MMTRRRIVIFLGLLVMVGAVLAVLLWRSSQRRTITLTGAVIQQNAEPGKQQPIADVEITAANGVAVHATKSDPSGLFHLTLRPGVRPGAPVTLEFKHPDYKPLILTEPAGDRLYIARMSPTPPAVRVALGGSPVNIAHAKVRYTLRTETTVSVGSAVKTFEAVNTGNIPCKGQSPCSPDGKWKAAVASVSLDAGKGNEFRDPRVSCIAGPCPFTKIESDQLSESGRIIKVSVRDWSDTTTFLLQAEVVHRVSDNVVRHVYPVIFGKNLNFILPAEAEGPSIEAEVNGAAIVFPLGPDSCLTWADCRVRVDPDHTHVYRCELKPGYQFR